MSDIKQTVITVEANTAVRKDSVLNRNLTLAEQIEKDQAKYLEEVNGELVERTITGAQFSQGPYGTALVDIKWKPKAKNENKNEKK